MTIDSDGKVGIGTTAPDSTLKVKYTGTSESIVKADATSATYGGLGLVHMVATARSSTDAFRFMTCWTGGDTDDQFRFHGNGDAYNDGTWITSGADYAEYFESKDGNAIAVGTTVKLDGDKIVACESGDTPIGVVRPKGCSTTIGNAAWGKWQGKYLVDDYSSPVKEEYSVTKWIEDTEDIQYQTDKIPEDVTVPDDAIVTSTEEDGSKLMRKKLNPDWNDSEEYSPRSERDEWVIVGLLGQIPVAKGQPTGNWIKMKDISDTVEMYFVK
jgi:uncharacterized beta-barrel protein YwiB (DUF1934 family)